MHLLGKTLVSAQSCQLASAAGKYHSLNALIYHAIWGSPFIFHPDKQTNWIESGPWKHLYLSAIWGSFWKVCLWHTDACKLEFGNLPWIYRQAVLPLSLKSKGLILHSLSDLVPIFMPSSSQGGEGWVFRGRRRKREKRRNALWLRRHAVCVTVHTSMAGLSLLPWMLFFPLSLLPGNLSLPFRAQPKRLSVFRVIISAKA